jgi:hypothetical protein
MSLNKGTLDPLGVLKLKKLNFIPEHFIKITVNNTVDVDLLNQWIEYHLNSRYAIKKAIVIDSQNKMKEIIEIGLENPKEMLLLTLGCPYLNNN